MSQLAVSGKLLAAEKVAGAAAPSIDPFRYSSTLQNATIGITIAFAALAFIVVCTRVAGRLSSHQFGLDDVLVCIAMVLSILETVATYMFIKTNFIGVRGQDIPPHDPMPGLVWNYAVAILYNPILALAKTSLLLLLLRLFGQKPGVRRFIVWVNTANIGMMIAVFLATVVQCIPIQKTWQPTSLEGRCIDRRTLFTVLSSFNIFTDILIIALPLSIFIGLKIPRRTKIALMLVFLLGFLTTAASIVRLFLLVQGLFKRGLSTDAEIGFVTSAFETNLALITVSAPALRPLLRAWFPRLSRVGRNEVVDSTGRRVLGMAATRMTRLRSQSQVRSRNPQENEEATTTSSSMAKNNDGIARYNTGSDQVRPGTATGCEADTGTLPLERWV